MCVFVYRDDPACNHWTTSNILFMYVYGAVWLRETFRRNRTFQLFMYIKIRQAQLTQRLFWSQRSRLCDVYAERWKVPFISINQTPIECDYDDKWQCSFCWLDIGAAALCDMNVPCLILLWVLWSPNRLAKLRWGIDHCLSELLHCNGCWHKRASRTKSIKVWIFGI